MTDQKTHLQREIGRLKERVLALGAEVERCMDGTHRALMSSDHAAADRVIAYDREIDEHEVDIEEECLKILALYQPVASDLRLVVAALKINNDLERIADLAANIAEYIVEMAKLEKIEISPQFDLMFKSAREMVKGSLDAFVQADAVLAQKVCGQDDVVDQLNREIIANVREQLIDKPSKIRSLLYLISVSRNIERIADYATNVAEDVYYLVHGSIIRHAHGIEDKGAQADPK